eukprot:CAMPEP_0175336550 /NCGR_PEP_ID=MMETSP0095-20121207/3868_1 /TAXON_ID=311494 /ORGANISM="Alexandrium monilatum, Strain CCMP3105" /LENGTH=501 /DNA_ID=CAMNT_0016633907 /DNA_START=60 /DNA_END=1565 /DNA_ORIENTATION=-
MADIPFLLEEDVRKNEDLVRWGNSELPSWIQDERIHRILRNEGHFKPIQLAKTAGPAVLWGWSTLAGLTYFLAALPIVGTYIARCPSSPTSVEFATYPEVLLWIIFFLPLTVIVLVAQWKVATFTFAPMIMTIRKHKMDTDQPWPFNLWFSVMSLMTVFNLLDQMTNALFAAKTWATRQCYGHRFIQRVWKDTLHQSFVCRMLKIDCLDLDFAQFTVAIYFFQLIVQPAMALLYSVPIAGRPVNYAVITDQSGKIAQYKTFSDDFNNPDDMTTHDAAAVILAETNRMEVVVANGDRYRKAEFSGYVRHLQKSDHPGTELSKRGGQILDKSLEAGLLATGRGIARFSMRGLLQNAVQVHLQVTMAAISKTVLAGEGGMDYFNAFSIGITIIAMFLDIPDMTATYSFTVNVLKEVERYPLESMQHQGLKKKVSILRWRALRLKVYGFLYAGLALLAFVKLVMAVGVCKYGTWNLTFNSDWGCADVTYPQNLTACPVGEYLCPV